MRARHAPASYGLQLTNRMTNRVAAIFSLFLLSTAARAQLVPLTDGIQVVAGAFHNCALTSAGGVKCWGDNRYGQLGDNSTTSRPTPVDVSGLSSGVKSISAGIAHTCALTGAGGVKCRGLNSSGL